MSSPLIPESVSDNSPQSTLTTLRTSYPLCRYSLFPGLVFAARSATAACVFALVFSLFGLFPKLNQLASPSQVPPTSVYSAWSSQTGLQKPLLRKIEWLLFKGAKNSFISRSQPSHLWPPSDWHSSLSRLLPLIPDLTLTLLFVRTPSLLPLAFQIRHFILWGSVLRFSAHPSPSPLSLYDTPSSYPVIPTRMRYQYFIVLVYFLSPRDLLYCLFLSFSKGNRGIRFKEKVQGLFAPVRSHKGISVSPGCNPERTYDMFWRYFTFNWRKTSSSGKILLLNWVSVNNSYCFLMTKMIYCHCGEVQPGVKRVPGPG